MVETSAQQTSPEIPETHVQPKAPPPASAPTTAISETVPVRPVTPRSKPSLQVNSNTLSNWATVLAMVIGVLSLLYTTSTYLEQREFRTRSQLTDTLSRLNDMITESILTRHANESRNLVEQLGTESLQGAYAQQGRLLTLQAINLANSIPDQVNFVDWNTIAVGAGTFMSPLEADIYHLKTLESAPNDIQWVNSQASYASFLFGALRIDEGRDAYQQLFSRLETADFESTYYNVYYLHFMEQWWAAELNQLNLTEAFALIQAQCDFALTLTEGSYTRHFYTERINAQWITSEAWRIRTESNPFNMPTAVGFPTNEPFCE